MASFIPIHGQGMSSAALHASCLASYFDSGADLDAAATDFFRLQQVVVDVAWVVSAGGDAFRLDAETAPGTLVEGSRRALALMLADGGQVITGLAPLRDQAGGP